MGRGSNTAPRLQMKLNLKIEGLKDFGKAYMAMPDIAAKKLRLTLNKVLRSVIYDARGRHRYKSRSGNLSRSTTYTISRDGLSAELFLDEGIAKYGKYVHDGQRSWDKDEFLYSAVDKNEDEIVEAIDDAVGKIIKEAGF
jgi:hypothetical protein